MTPFRLIRLTRASTGSIGLTDQGERDALAEELRSKRRAQTELWKQHGYPRSFRTQSEYAHANL